MEILEEIATEDHFERELDSEEEQYEEDDDRDIFEMPLISTVVVPIIHPEHIEQLSQQQNYQPQQMQNIEHEIPELREENIIQPYSQDQQQIQQLRLHQHSPNCRPPKPNGNGDEFIF
jgi:hypothetical protein